jgi:hypothetical protein
MHIVILVAAVAGILGLLRRILPARMAARIPVIPTEASSVHHPRIVLAVLAIVVTLVWITVLDLGAVAANVIDVFKRLHGLN